MEAGDGFLCGNHQDADDSRIATYVDATPWLSIAFSLLSIAEFRKLHRTVPLLEGPDKQWRDFAERADDGEGRFHRVHGIFGEALNLEHQTGSLTKAFFTLSTHSSSHPKTILETLLVSGVSPGSIEVKNFSEGR